MNARLLLIATIFFFFNSCKDHSENPDQTKDPSIEEKLKDNIKVLSEAFGVYGETLQDSDTLTAFNSMGEYLGNGPRCRGHKRYLSGEGYGVGGFLLRKGIGHH